MNLQTLPKKIALVLAMSAFSVTWCVGLLCQVPSHTIAWRSLVAAAIFWAGGLIMGHLFVDGLSQALSEYLQKEEARQASENSDSR